nr:MAG TPA: hypothetical protein [Caudoviricetes sp.]
MWQQTHKSKKCITFALASCTDMRTFGACTACGSRQQWSRSLAE